MLQEQNTWEETEPEATFKYSKVNCNLLNYYRFDKAFSNELCNDIRVRLQDAPLVDGTVGTGKVDSDIRVSKVCWLPKTSKFLDVYSMIFGMAGKANDVFFNFNLESIDSKIQYTVYDETFKGYYDWHIDVGAHSTRRKLSVVVQLSDPSEYEGGELQIHCGKVISVEKDKGTVIIFPSYLLHRVTPVTKGTRRTLVVWIDGPPFN
jgi:PKHD-type hydroxylase